MANKEFSDIFVTSRVRLARNLAGVPFPSKIRERWAVDMLKSGTAKAADDVGFKYRMIDMSDISEIERKALAERHFISFNLCENERFGALLMSDDDTISVMLNEEDHIREQCILKGFCLPMCYNVINYYDDAVINRLPIAYDSSFGFLTSCLTNIGTGMRASVMLFLPALTMKKNMSSWLRNFIKYCGGEVTIRGVYGEGSKALGSMYQISNSQSIGLTEADIINKVEAAAAYCYDHEAEARLSLLQKNGIELVDSVYRAYGILSYAKQLTSEAFFEYVSLLKLGMSLEVIELKDTVSLDNLMIMAQPNSLSKHEGRELSPAERDVVRARLVNESIKLLK